MWAFKALVARLIVAGVLIQSPILATAQESAEPKSGAKRAQTVTFRTAKSAQPPSLVRLHVLRYRYGFDYVPSIFEDPDEFLPESQPLAASPARVQENSDERVEASPRIQATPSVAPEMSLIDENQ
jgi:hypothetical protein